MSIYDSKLYTQDVAETAKAAQTLAGTTVLVTGAGGLIGSFLTDTLLFAGARVIALGRSAKRLKARFGDRENLTLVEADVSLPLSLELPADYVVHAASNAYPAAFKSDPVGTVTANVIGTKNLLDYAKSVSARRFLFVSTGEVYGQGDGRDFTEDYSGYVDPTDPRSCYPASKRAAETLCVSFTAQFGLDTVIARPCHVYGPSATSRDNRASTQFLSLAAKGEPVVLHSAGAQLRSYMYVADCVGAIITVLLSGECGRAYNIANENARATVAEFANLAANAAGVPCVFDIPEGSVQTGITRGVLDNSRLRALGWSGRYTVPDGVSRTIGILREFNVKES